MKLNFRLTRFACRGVISQKIKQSPSHARMHVRTYVSTCERTAADFSHPVYVQPAPVKRRLQESRRPLRSLLASSHQDNSPIADVVKVHVGVLRLNLTQQPPAYQHFLRRGGRAGRLRLASTRQHDRCRAPVDIRHPAAWVATHQRVPRRCFFKNKNDNLK